MSKYPNLERSLFFKALPPQARQQITNQPDLGSACYELQLQLEKHPECATELHRRQQAGEGIDAIKESGLKIWLGDMNDEQWQHLVELDPASYHPDSTRMTPSGRARWDALISEWLGPNWREEL